jgi:sugar phosphate isomerase/epimerase
MLMPSNSGTLDLLAVPGALAQHGFQTMELCHFHLPSTTPGYLAELRGSIEASGIELWSLLIDDGNINHPETGDRDRDWVAGWIERAGKLGARCVRVIAGKEAWSSEALIRSAEQLLRLCEVGDRVGVRVLTENWFDTAATPEAIVQLFEFTSQRIGLCFDFGNWGGADKYDKLARIANYATSCHAKCQYVDGLPDRADFERCLEITRNAGFDGPYTLVHGEVGKVWESLDRQREMLDL